MFKLHEKVIFKYIIDVKLTTLIFLLLGRIQMTSSTACDQIKTPAGQAPSLPNLPDTFQVNVEANVINKGKTISAKLYYDYAGNRATIKLFENGLDGQIVFNLMTDEVYTISGDLCTTRQFSTSNFSQWLGIYQSEGKIRINKSQSILHFGKRFGEVFVGNDTIRGISVNHWKSCPNIPSWNSFTVDYYFSAGKWSTSSTVSAAPVKAEVRGSKTLPNGTIYNIYHVYDYFNYRPGIDDADDSIFQTPTDTFCPGRKKGKPLPKLPIRFYYRTEKIYVDMSAVTFEDVWYDEIFQLFRRDYHPLTPSNPANTMHPLTEIHDYKTGVRYLIDKIYGNCTTSALSTGLSDTSVNIAAAKYNGSFVLNMKNPHQLFHLDLNYTFIGQVHPPLCTICYNYNNSQLVSAAFSSRFEQNSFLDFSQYLSQYRYKLINKKSSHFSMLEIVNIEVNQVRGILCDTYVASTENLTVAGFARNQKSIITIYFTAQEWTNILDSDKNIDNSPVPVKMDILAEEIGLSTTMNFLDFDPNPPSLDVFDINKCFYEANKITFQLKFPGTLIPQEIPALNEWAHLTLAEKMEVSILRITYIHLDYDDANIFVSATLLDRTSFTAQFTKIAGKAMEHQNDEVIYKASSARQCASYCVNNPSFVCNSFDVCTADKSCHLSKRHTDDGVVINTAQSCDHYSRNVNGIIPEKSIADAYKLLRENVYSNTLQLNRLGDKVYTAVDVTLTFGWMTPVVKLPVQLPGSYSYEIEVSIPSNQHVYTAKVWYDDGFKIIRYDPHFNRVMFPYYTTSPLSVVEDFNTGIKYVTDKSYRNCTVSQLAQNDFGTNMASNKSANSTYKLFIKDPLQLFKIDDTYYFVGQQTVRGMTCNVFESLRSDFVLENTVVNAIFRYAFLSDEWMETSDGYLGGAVGQPVRLEITVLKPTYYMEYNFYNFDTDHPDMTLFDVRQCFSAQNTKEFQITFPGRYETYLSTSANMFLIEATFIMSRLSGASIHRFQGTRLDHDNDNIYLTSSLVEQPNKMLYFTRMSNGFVPEHVDKVVAQPQTPRQCAVTCFSNSDFVCNSFYVCTESAQCLLSKKHSPDGPNSNQTTCISYSRTVDNSSAEYSNLIAFLNLKNSVFNNNFTLNIPIPDTENNKAFSASYIKDVFLSDKLHDTQDNSILNFDIHSVSTIVPIDKSLTYVDIGGCATACLTEKSFQCHGFSYCFDKFLCVISKTHPDQLNNKNIQSQVNCTTYNRKYENEYVKLNGVVSLSSSSLPFSTVETNEKCAQSCSSNVDCRMFEYCINTKRCVLYDERNFGQQENPSAIGCNVFISPYVKDFQSVDAGTFKFSSTVTFQGITNSDCAKNCIQLQMGNCKGFYYSAKTATCYLPGEGGVVTPLATEGGGTFCEQYQRIHFPQSQPTSSSIRSTSAVDTSSRLTKSISAKTSSTTQRTTNDSPETSTLSSSKTSPCLSVQRQSSSDTKPNKGVTAGASVGAFLLGLLMGAVGFYLFRRYRNLDNDGLKTNFIEHEDM